MQVVVTSRTVSQVMELMEDGDHFVPQATGGSFTTGTPEILTPEKPEAELELEFMVMEAVVTGSPKGKKEHLYKSRKVQKSLTLS